MQDDITELFSPPKVITIARRSGLQGNWAFDRLVERAPGEAWDLTKREHQIEVERIISKVKPKLSKAKA